MEIERVITGYLEENCYIIKKNDKCLIVDPGDNYDLIYEKIKNLKVLGLLITHHHFDHIGAIDKLLKDFSVPIYDFNNCREMMYKINNFIFEVIYFPGHSKDSIGFYFKSGNLMFVGDFVFYETVGRCDLEGGNFNEMLISINKLKKYNDSIKLYPGHGQATTIGYEKKNNVYFK